MYQSHHYVAYSLCTRSNHHLHECKYAEDWTLIRILRQTKNYSARKFLAQFPVRHWSLRLLAQSTSAADWQNRLCRHGGCRQRTTCMTKNIETIAQLIFSQENAPLNQPTACDPCCCSSFCGLLHWVLWMWHLSVCLDLELCSAKKFQDFTDTAVKVYWCEVSSLPVVHIEPPILPLATKCASTNSGEIVKFHCILETI